MSRISKAIYDSTVTPLSIRDIDELLQMYKDGLLTEAMLDKAIAKGWITEEQKIQIILSK